MTAAVPYRKSWWIVSQQVLHHGIQTLQRGYGIALRLLDGRGCGHVRRSADGLVADRGFKILNRDIQPLQLTSYRTLRKNL